MVSSLFASVPAGAPIIADATGAYAANSFAETLKTDSPKVSGGMVLEPGLSSYSQDAQDPAWFMRGRSVRTNGSRRSRRSRRTSRLARAEVARRARTPNARSPIHSPKDRTRSPTSRKKRTAPNEDVEMGDDARRVLAAELEVHANEGASSAAESRSPPPTRAGCEKPPVVRDSAWWRNLC